MTPLEQVKGEIDDLANSVINLTEENARLQRINAELCKDKNTLLADDARLEEVNSRLRAALEVAPQLEQALSEYLADPQWHPTRGHIERARNDAARMAAALAKEGKCAQF